MVEASQIITIVLILIVALVLWKLVKTVAKIFITVIIVFLIFFSISSYFIYKDVVDFKQNVGKGNIIVLADEDIITGFFMDSQKPRQLTEEEISQYTSYYRSTEYDSILGENYKVFIIKVKTVEDIENLDIQYGDLFIPGEKVIKALKSDHPAGVIGGELGESSVGELFDAEIKAFLFSTLFTEQIIQKPTFLMTQLKKGNVVIHPETPMFKFLKFIPVKFLDLLGSDKIKKGEEKMGVVLEKV